MQTFNKTLIIDPTFTIQKNYKIRAILFIIDYSQVMVKFNMVGCKEALIHTN